MIYNSNNGEALLKSITSLKNRHTDLLNSFSQLRNKISKYRLPDSGVLFNASPIEVEDNETSFHIHFASKTVIFKYSIFNNTKQHLDTNEYIGGCYVFLRNASDGSLVNVISDHQPFLLFSELEETFSVYDQESPKGYRELNFAQFILSFIDIILSNIESI